MDLDQLKENEELKKLLDDKQLMMFDRGEITLNGVKFIINPIYIGEEEQYERDVPYRLTPRDLKEGEEYTDKELALHIMRLFSKSQFKNKPLPVKKKLFKNPFRKKKYIYEDRHINGLVMWLQKKVTQNGKNINFYDLERKYKLNKSEIARLIIKLMEISGFF